MAAAEAETQNQDSKVKISQWDLMLKFKERFENEKPTEESVTSFLKEEYNVDSFSDLGLGRKWKGFVYQYRPVITWTEDKMTFPTDEEVDSILKRQLEFYFSDGNLPRDDFLQNILTPATNPEQWVNITVLLTFKRVRMYTQDVARVARILSDSETLDVSEDGTKVKRKIPCTLTKEDLNDRLTIVSSLKMDTTEKSFREFLSTHGNVLSVFISKNRRGNKQTCTARVHWATIEESEQFAALKTITHNEQDIKIRKSKESQDAKKEIQNEERFKRIFFIQGLPENTAFEAVKDWLTLHEIKQVRFVKMIENKTATYIRLAENAELEAAEAVAKVNGKDFEGQPAQASIIPEEDYQKVVTLLQPVNKKRKFSGKDSRKKKRQRT